MLHYQNVLNTCALAFTGSAVGEILVFLIAFTWCLFPSHTLLCVSVYRRVKNNVSKAICYQKTPSSNYPCQVNLRYWLLVGRHKLMLMGHVLINVTLLIPDLIGDIDQFFFTLVPSLLHEAYCICCNILMALSLVPVLKVHERVKKGTRKILFMNISCWWWKMKNFISS